MKIKNLKSQNEQEALKKHVSEPLFKKYLDYAKTNDELTRVRDRLVKMESMTVMLVKKLAKVE